MRLLDRLRERLPPTAFERGRLALAAALVGIGAGAGVALFRGLIGLVDRAGFGTFVPWLEPVFPWAAALVPVIGGLAAGLLVAYAIGHERHHGVSGIIEAVAIDGGRLRYRRAPAKAAGAAIAIGTGASVGPEDPSVQIGANLGSFLGQRLDLGEERTRMLVAAGAAAGVAAAFGAPIAGVFFALEVILGDLAGTGAGLILVTAVLAAFTGGALGGEHHTLDVTKYELRSGWEIPLHLGLGAAIGPLAAVYVRLIDGARAYFERTQRRIWIRPVLAGAAVGVASVWYPQVRGTDYGTLERVLGGGETLIHLLLVLGVLKLVLTALCIGAGFPGGVFAPALFIGCVFGGAYGAAAAGLLPALDLRPGAFAVAGMAAFLAAAVHAPMTAVLIVFEITHDYGMVAAAMSAVALSTAGARWVETESVYSRALVRKGFRRRALSSLETERATVAVGAPCAGRRVRDVAWPKGCVVARVRRGARSFTPGGDATIEPGDEVVAVVDAAAREPFLALCHAPPSEPPSEPPSASAAGP